MVLRLLLVALLAGCPAPETRVVRLPQAEPMVVAYVLENESSPELVSVPARFTGSVAEELARRNLTPQVVPEEQFAAEFATRRTTRDRLEWTTGKASSRFVLLVEAKAAYFAQVEGRFRWTVSVRASISSKEGGEPLQSDFEVPIVLEFHHEREREALDAAGPVIAPRVGALLDRFLGGMGTAPTRTAATPAPSDYDAIYFVLVDRFENGDAKNDGEVDRADPQAWHGGDLAGVKKRLDWLESLGVRTVWLSPVFRARTEKFHGYGAFHGYWTHDLGSVEARFGSEAELRALADALHERGMRLVLDLVVNHVAWDAPVRAEHPDWFHEKGAIADWNDRVQLETHDVHGLPDLAQEKAAVYRWLLDGASRWVGTADGYRLDAVKHVPLSFWARFNGDLRARGGDGFLLLGELLDGDPTKVAATLREGRFGSLFDFPLTFALVDVFCKDRPVGRLAAMLSMDRLYDDPNRLVTLLDNHDLPRVASLCGGDERRVEQALAVQLTARGVPSLTYGTEVGLSGEKEPANRGPMRFDADHPLRRVVTSLLQARRAHPALVRGRDRVIAFDGRLFAYARVVPEEAVVVAVNRGAQAAALELPPELAKAARRDLLGGGPLEALSVPAGGVLLVSLVPETPFTAPRPDKRVVELEAPAGTALVGAGPELGDWQPARALRETGGRIRLELEAGRVYEHKLVTGAKWQPGDNRYLYVPAGRGVLRGKVCWEAECRP